MKLLGNKFTIVQVVSLILYYGFAIHLPSSQSFFCGEIWRYIREVLCRHIFKKCGKNINVEHGAVFGSGRDIEIGDYSGIGINAHIPSDSIIGKYVMMGPNCSILNLNHEYQNLDIPMCFQGCSEKKRVVIEDDCWIGRNVLITPGRTIKKGSIIAAGCVLCKDFPEYSIIGGNPSKFIKLRSR